MVRVTGFLVWPHPDATLGPVEQTESAHPSRIGHIAFVLSVVGGLVAGVGATRSWTVVVGFLTPSRGLDYTEGLAAFVLAMTVLVSALAARRGRSRKARRSAAVVIIVAASLIIGLGVYAASVLPSRVRSEEIDQGVAAGVARGFDEQAVRTQLEGSVSVALRDGIWLCILGGLLGITGGILTLRWARTIAAGGPDAPEGAGEPTPSVEPTTEA